MSVSGSSRGRTTSHSYEYEREGISRDTPMISSHGPGAPSSPPLQPSNSTEGGYPTINESISILDPRRFTPTLHASLVSEILSLRRDVDARDALITDLEVTLSDSKSDNEQLSQRLSSQGRDHRNVKRQLQQIEQSTVSALEELVKERDELKDTNRDLKSKLEDSNKRYKDREDDLQREFAELQRERSGWTGEQKRLERRAHVAEGRLRSVLDELVAHAGNGDVNVNGRHADSEDEDTRDSGLGNESDGMSVKSQSPSKKRQRKHSRNMSSASQRSLRAALNRFSTTSNASMKLANGLSLADELNLDNFDEEDEDYADLDLEEDEDEFTELELRELRAKRARESRMSSMMGWVDEKAKRILGITGEMPSRNSMISPIGHMTQEAQHHDNAPHESNGDTALPKDMVLPALRDDERGFSIDTGGSEHPIESIEEVSGEEGDSVRRHTKRDSRVLKEVARFETMVRSTPSPTFTIESVRPKRSVHEKRESARLDLLRNVDDSTSMQKTTDSEQERLEGEMKPVDVDGVDDGVDDGVCRTCGLPCNRPPVFEAPPVEEPQQELQNVPAPATNYVEASTQFSPPPSPKIGWIDEEKSTATDILELGMVADGEPTKAVAEENSASPTPTAEAEPQKPAPVMVSTAIQTLEEPLSPPATPKLSPPPSPTHAAIPEHEEQVEEPTDLQAVPLTPTRLPPLPPPKPEMVSMSTQTEVEEIAKERMPTEPTRLPPPVPTPMFVPAIAIHPPDGSRPTSLQSVVLPPGTKNVSCQTTFETVVPMMSVSMQTDPIRIDQRLARLPAHLLPSAISSQPPTPELAKSGGRVFGSVAAGKKPAAVYTSEDDAPPVPRIPDDLQTEDRYPGNNDNGPLARTVKGDIIRRPFRDSSLFAGFNGLDDESEARSDNELSEDDSPKRSQYQTPVAQGRGKVARALNFPTPVPEENEVLSRSHDESDFDETSYGTYPEASQPERPSFSASTRSSFERPNKVAKSMRSASGSITRQPSIRRSAMIHSGTNAHIRSRSPSIGSVASSSVATMTTTTTMAGASRPPPFPVPNRGSSRRVFSGGKSKSEGSQSPTPRSVTSSFAGRRAAPPRPLQRRDSLRKTRSAVHMTRPVGSSHQARSRSPPLSGGAHSPLDSPVELTPQVPPLPSNMASYQHSKFTHGSARRTARDARPSREQLRTTDHEVATHPPQGSAGVETPAGQASVVEAIAQTMVGEWMYKYVRRRKSFGVASSQAQAQAELAEVRGIEDGGAVSGVMSGSGGQRHKRWVWLSPYERAIMWSSKQPTSGNALLGKSGRKLTIQSVLDVKDDTPLPKGATGVPFNRSILILTPARALKFTATTSERHYLWLTALSFLSHSATGAPELANLPNLNLAINNLPSSAAAGSFPGAPPMPQIPDTHDDVSASPPPISRGPAPSLRRGGPIRDSVLLAKGKRPMPGSRQQQGTGTAPPPPISTADALISDAADAPTIPRFHTHAPERHGRKRSMTGPRIPPVNRGWGSYERSVTNPGPVPTTGYSGYSGYSGSSGPSYSATVRGGPGTPSPTTSNPPDKFIPWAVPTNASDCDAPPFLKAEEVGSSAPSASNTNALNMSAAGPPPSRRLNTSTSAKEYGTWHAPSSGRTSRSSRPGPLTLNGVHTLPSSFGGGSQPSSALASPSIAGFGGAGRSSEGSSNRSSMLPNNFFEALGPNPGTVRMEAFVEGRGTVSAGGGMWSGRGSEESGRFLGGPERGHGMNGYFGGKGKGTGIGVGTRRNGSQWSASGSDPRRVGGVYADEFEGSDPFRGF
ncbi:hypothetical protein P152DRAFT_121653 [Eremomyces bilateralis CBS 781.70]|uniref:Pleckstrin homology domain-containing protein n=1 Tax=Eremomyces bilateralis CBS 781.70 TaxID=1392243 RepID=A0A6G1GEQ9_9PEZI|nr:uncharacterized protein P152DRAFT_121653 [Eremomyces bilateralis CBS 781.70]KAF1816391.1 hypothetical protein P152DRAFT_121653 [Eremomyces bilateralis CBS 781.70]